MVIETITRIDYYMATSDSGSCSADAASMPLHTITSHDAGSRIKFPQFFTCDDIVGEHLFAGHDLLFIYW